MIGSDHVLRSDSLALWAEAGSGSWPRAVSSNTRQDVFHEGTLIAEYRNRQGGGAADFGFVPTHGSELRIGYEAANQKLYPSVGALTYGHATRAGSGSARSASAWIAETLPLFRRPASTWRREPRGTTRIPARLQGFPLAEHGSPTSSR